VFDADEAFNKGLIYQLSNGDSIEHDVKLFIDKLLVGVSGQSVAGIKYMLRNMPSTRQDALKFAAEMNAMARSSDDCKRGIDAFLNKEKLSW
jgi:methylglutaconyl-CoA hydratase